MLSKIIGAIGSTYSARKEETDQGYQSESGHCWDDTHLDIYGCEAWTLQARHKGHIQATQMRVLSWIEGVSRLVRMKKVSLGAYWSSKEFQIYTVYGEEVAAELEAIGRSDE